jgi:hypothetical protein
MQLRRHLGKHQQELALFAIPSHARGQPEDDDESIKDEDSRSLSSDHSISSSILPEEDACPICNLAFKGETTERRAAMALHMTELHPDQDQSAVEPDPRFPMFRVLLDRKGRRINPDKVKLAVMAVSHWRTVVQRQKREKLSFNRGQNEPLGDRIADEDDWGTPVWSYGKGKIQTGAKEDRRETGVEAIESGDSGGHSSQAPSTLTVNDTNQGRE